VGGLDPIQSRSMLKRSSVQSIRTNKKGILRCYYLTWWHIDNRFSKDSYIATKLLPPCEEAGLRLK